MRASLRLLFCVPLVAVLIAWSGIARADEAVRHNPQDMMKTLKAAATPGAEHAKLQPLLGSWNYTCKFWLAPNEEPLESKGTIERRWVLGGRFLEETVRGTNFDGTPGFEGLGLLGYDIPQRKYTFSWLSSMGTGTCAGLGVVDSSGTVFTFDTEGFCPIQKKIVKGRDEVRIETPDKIVIESYHIENGKERKVMELVSLRKVVEQ